MPRGKKPVKAERLPPDTVRIRITNKPGMYATLGLNGELLVVPEAQAGTFLASAAPAKQKELERRGYKTTVEPI